jgi:hypothetical protein
VPPATLVPDSFSEDVRDFLYTLHGHAVRFMIVGGEAVIFYGHVRLTGDIDVFFDRSADNADRLLAALDDFWHGVIPGIRCAEELRKPGVVFQFGLPPNRIDLLNEIDGVAFEDAWPRRTEVEIAQGAERISFSYLGLEDLIANKRAAGRPKDLDDLRFLEAVRSADEDS